MILSLRAALRGAVAGDVAPNSNPEPVNTIQFLVRAARRWRLVGSLLAAGLGAAAWGAPLIIDVREAGAVGDGQALCTAAIQQCIDRCAAAGGGTVLLAGGTYVSGTLEMKSRVTLQIEAGATLLGSPRPQDYPARRSAVRSYTDNYVRQALLVGENLEHVTLRGAGTIDGNGGAFRWKEYLTRPYVIRFVQCRDVLVEGLTLQASPMWMQHYLACDRLRLRGLRVFNHVSYNNDGLDLDGCHDVAVSDCVFDTDDDALCLKSTLDRACENVTISNCVLSSHCNAFKLGTESNGGFQNITLANCVILSPRFSKVMYGIQRGLGGIALEMVDGGRLENVAISNVTIDGVNVPIFLRLGHRARPFAADGPKPAMGSFRNVSISNVIATRTGSIGCSITGLPGHAVENVALVNVSVESAGGGKRELVDKAIPELPGAYPESRMFGDLPAYGFYCRHVRGLTIDGLRLHARAPDARHALVCDDVQGLDLHGLKTGSAPGSAPVVRLTQCQDMLVRGCYPGGVAEVFLQVDGDASRGIALVGNDLSRVGRVAQIAGGLPPEVVREAGNLGPPTVPR